MGLDFHVAEWLSQSRFWPGTDVLTVGRQNWWLSRRESRNLGIPNPPKYGRDVFADFFWDWLGASCESVDVSAADHPTHLLDMGEPRAVAASGLGNRFRVVVDLGAGEHVANQAAYWGNIHAALVPGGTLYAVLPADGLCGHGLYQYSPEFFGAMGGFYVTSLQYVTYGLRVRWRPAEYGGRRFQHGFGWPTYVAARLVRATSPFSLPVQFQGGATVYRPPSALVRWAVELPGIRVVERIAARLRGIST